MLWVTGQAVEQEVNPALDKADSQMKCLIAKVQRSKAVEPENYSVVKSLQFMSCTCLSLPWCLVCVALTWHLSISLRQQTFSPVKVHNCLCPLISLFRLSVLWVCCSLILSPLLWGDKGAGWALLPWNELFAVHFIELCQRWWSVNWSKVIAVRKVPALMEASCENGGFLTPGQVHCAQCAVSNEPKKGERSL